jgi:hypothetical protein
MVGCDGVKRQPPTDPPPIRGVHDPSRHDTGETCGFLVSFSFEEKKREDLHLVCQKKKFRSGFTTS